MKKSLCLNFLLVSIACSIYGQDVSFSNGQQFLVNQNPAFAGSNGGFRSQSVYRSQSNYYRPYVVYGSSADAYLKKIKGGIAISYVHEDWNRGMLTNSNLSLTYAQYFSLAENKLKIIPSLQFEFMQKKLDPTKMSFSEIFSLSGGFTQQKHNYGLSSGLLVNYDRFYFGASIFHINQPNMGLLGDNYLPARLSVYSSMNAQLNIWTKANLSIRYDYQAKHQTLFLNWNTVYANHIIFNIGANTQRLATVGAGYRNNFFSASATYGIFFYPAPFKHRSIFEINLSINLRDKEQRKLLNNFEAQ